MAEPNGDQASPRKTLVCVLDWGLGHAARSLALLDHPALADDEIHLAASGHASVFLRRERPDLPLHELPAYNVRYPTGNMPLNVALQFPRWWLTARRERRVTQRIVRENNIDRVISDNRFGCYANAAPSIFLTHQLHPITNSRPVSWLYRRYLRRFDEYWVPDNTERALSGRLSSPEGYEKVSFIGPLSRLSKLSEVPKSLRTLSLLSGPEPMRSRLEAALVKSLASIPGNHHIVRGLPAAAALGVPPNIAVSDFADRDILSGLIPQAEVIICRSGYSTLMDLAATGTDAKIILVPTPGQTEQHYLALTQVQRGEGRVATLPQHKVSRLNTLL